MAILSTLQALDIADEYGKFAEQSVPLTQMFIAERAKAAPNIAGLSTEVQALVNTVILALYNQAAPTILP